jgi:Tfp pilus assembly protein PilO
MQWLLGAGIACTLATFYVVGYRPAIGRLEVLKLQLQSKQRELEQNQNKARNLPILAFEVQQLESQVRVYDRQFPQQPELGQFIKDITQISQQLALGEWKYQPGAPKRWEGFCELPIQMHFRGDFLNVASFLRQVEDLQRMTRIRRLSVKSKDNKAGAVEVDLGMMVYFSEG